MFAKIWAPSGNCAPRCFNPAIESVEIIMHEMGIALQIVDIARASIPEDMVSPRVERIHLKVGKLAAVIVDNLTFCFEVAAKETVLAGAELVVEEIPVTARCRQCRAQWTIDEPVFVCRDCQSGDLEILSGRELDIESIDVLEEDEKDAV